MEAVDDTCLANREVATRAQQASRYVLCSAHVANVAISNLLPTSWRELALALGAEFRLAVAVRRRAGAGLWNHGAITGGVVVLARVVAVFAEVVAALVGVRAVAAIAVPLAGVVVFAGVAAAFCDVAVLAWSRCCSRWNRRPLCARRL